MFVDSILKGTKPVVSGSDGLKALKVAELILNKIQYSQKGL
jgi:predicted dehydrogenase